MPSTTYSRSFQFIPSDLRNVACEVAREQFEYSWGPGSLLVDATALSLFVENKRFHATGFRPSSADA